MSQQYLLDALKSKPLRYELLKNIHLGEEQVDQLIYANSNSAHHKRTGERFRIEEGVMRRYQAKKFQTKSILIGFDNLGVGIYYQRGSLFFKSPNSGKQHFFKITSPKLAKLSKRLHKIAVLKDSRTIEIIDYRTRKVIFRFQLSDLIPEIRSEYLITNNQLSQGVINFSDFSTYIKFNLFKRDKKKIELDQDAGDSKFSRRKIIELDEDLSKLLICKELPNVGKVDYNPNDSNLKKYELNFYQVKDNNFIKKSRVVVKSKSYGYFIRKGKNFYWFDNQTIRTFNIKEKKIVLADEIQNILEKDLGVLKCLFLMKLNE